MASFIPKDAAKIDFDDPAYLDGNSAADMFQGKNAQACYGATFDDLIVLPGHIDFGTDAIDLSAQVTKNLRLKLPFVR